MKLTSVLLFFLIMINSASGTINITVQSENNKTLSIINLQNFSTVAIGTNNQTFSNLSYANYELKLLSDSRLSVNDSFLFFEGGWSKLVYLALMLLIGFFIFYLVKGLSK